MTEYHPLHDGWTVSGADVADLPATVPGCVHTDLLAAGRIEDPYRDENETKQAWIGRTDWTYRTSFPADLDAPRIDLVCAGLDTVAEVVVNGEAVGRTANMHRSYRFDVRPLLRRGHRAARRRGHAATAAGGGDRGRPADRTDRGRLG